MSYLILSLISLLLLVSCGVRENRILDEAENDKGVALMGQYQYREAHEIFARLVDANPDWQLAKVNLAIATLNRQDPGDEVSTLAILNEVLSEDPANLRALYTSGVVHLYLGNTEEATEYFLKASVLDSGDPYTAYFLGQAHMQLENYEEALDYFQRSIELDEYLRSAYWAASTAARRLNRVELAESMLVDYQRYESNPLTRTANISYKQMGPKAEALSSNVPMSEVKQRPLPQGQLFGSPRVISSHPSTPTSITSVDRDMDGYTDIFLTFSDGATQLIRGNELGGFVADTREQIMKEPILAAYWGDISGDGITDSVLCLNDRLVIRVQESTESENVDVHDLAISCRNGVIYDADHDGDLDFLGLSSHTTNEESVGQGEQVQIVRYKTENQFLDLAELSRSFLNTRGEVDSYIPIVADFDADRDMDIFLASSNGKQIYLRNNRTWDYASTELPVALQDARVRQILAADTDANGRPELHVIDTRNVISVWEFDPGDGFVNKQSTTLPQIDGIHSFFSEDVDGDARLDYLIVGSAQLVVISSETTPQIRTFSIPTTTSAAIFVGDPKLGPQLIFAADEELLFMPAGAGRYPYIAIQTTGKSSADQMRSNASGIGTQLKIRNNGGWSVRNTLIATNKPGQNLQPIAVGTGGSEAVDYVELIWSDGVTQSEIGLAAGVVHHIEEVQRQLASCPIVFAWNGVKYEFVSDVLGVAALGYFLKPGEVAPVTSREAIRLDSGQLVARNGFFEVKIGEPMEEVLYLDSATLHAIDIPTGTDLILDERLNVAGEAATGRPIFYNKQILPTMARLADGMNVLDEISNADGIAPDFGPVHPRYVGLVRSPWELTLSFDRALPIKNTVLKVDGWVEFPYSQTSFAAYQDGMAYEAPTLEVYDGNAWHVQVAEFGYPAGMPRQMALPLGQLPKNTVKLRLTSNMEIYWDRITVVREIQSQKFDRLELPLNDAVVRKPGYALRSTLSQRRPYYDYDIRSTYWDAKYASGNYTQTGSVLELVDNADSAVAIIGSGEEIHLEFKDLTPSIDVGMKRVFILEFNGWAKDMDLYTESGEYVEPLPRKSNLSADDLSAITRLHDRFNTRFQGRSFSP